MWIRSELLKIAQRDQTQAVQKAQSKKDEGFNMLKRQKSVTAYISAHLS